MTFQPQICDQLCVISGKGKKVLDIFNQGRFDYMPQLVDKKSFSGDKWLITKADSNNNFKLSAKFLGETIWLDVLEEGLFEGLLIVVSEKKYTGRLWSIQESAHQEGLFKISTKLSGQLKFIDIYQKVDFNNMPYVISESDSRGQCWSIKRSKQDILELSV
jgi:hypothetical protein